MKSVKINCRFTLIEVLVAMAILALLGTSSYSGLLMAYRMINSAACRQEAQTLALDNAMAVFHQDYEEVLNEPAVNTEPVPPYSKLHELGGTIRTAVSHEDSHCRITVRVDWNDVALGGSNRVSSQTANLRRYNNEL